MHNWELVNGNFYPTRGGGGGVSLFVSLCASLCLCRCSVSVCACCIAGRHRYLPVACPYWLSQPYLLVQPAHQAERCTLNLGQGCSFHSHPRDRLRLQVELVNTDTQTQAQTQTQRQTHRTRICSSLTSLVTRTARHSTRWVCMTSPKVLAPRKI